MKYLSGKICSGKPHKKQAYKMDSAAFAFSHHWKSTGCKKLPTGFHPLEALFRFYCFPVRLTGTIQIHAGLYRKLRGPSPNDGLCYASSREPHQTGEPRGPLPSGGNSAANRLFSSSPAPYGRGVGCRAARGSACPVGTTAAGG